MSFMTIDGNIKFHTTNKWLKGALRARQIVCPVIPGTPKSVVGPLDILPGCSVGTLVLTLVASVNITALVTLPQARDHVMFEQVQWTFKASPICSKRWFHETIITTDVWQ